MRKQIETVPAFLYPRLAAALEQLSLDPRTNRPGLDCRKLRGQGGWRVRIGAWRMLYDVDDIVRVVEVTRVGPRPTVYR